MRKNSVEKKILYIVSIIFILLLFCSIRNTARSYRYRNLCDKYREQLSYAEAANRELNNRFISVQEVVGRIKETTDANITDARSIIETVERLRTEVQELEDCCGSFSQCEYYQYWDSYYHDEQLME